MGSPAVLLILDGFGLGKQDETNAIYQAKTPELDALFASCPHTTLSASGLDVGLPEGQIGNSEVGHTNIGAGRVVFQDLPRISRAIEDGTFFENPAYRAAMDRASAEGCALHLLGLVSDGGVHSHLSHIVAAVDMAKRRGLERVYIHALLDGRDVPPRSGKGYVQQLRDALRELGCGRIATVQGRFWGMDRDRRWERVQRGYDAMVRGVGVENPDPVAAVQASYAAGVSDEFVEPVVCDREGLIRPGDSVIFMNFRPDRARELTWALTGHLPEGHTMDTETLDPDFVCTTPYDETLPLPVAFPKEEIRGTLGEYISQLGLRQLRIAETEKYAHVTFFFNGGVERVYPGEDRVLVPSPKDFPTYDLIPEMSARPVTDECCRRIRSGDYALVVCNLANCDMVGHTGVLPAAIAAVETVDECVGNIVRAVRDMGGCALVTADHGNADCMRAPDGEPHTAHTTNPVPLIAVGAPEGTVLRPGRLADLAPTLLALMGRDKPKEMTGENLIVQD
ncbi:MAG: 2,3-bisphosphoglycerate-independent phosphoglycerate mutase [Oscillospiraceae bacterium]|nr:2,3-bisphosphoglycerate-independent phosphoglycerate mutase [Oscillospiraceae bacterium]